SPESCGLRLTCARPRMNEPNSLIKRAREVALRAYAPYSNFRVGAVVTDSSGTVYVGCNVESASYGLSMCAERSAIFAAIAGGAAGRLRSDRAQKWRGSAFDGPLQRLGWLLPAGVSACYRRGQHGGRSRRGWQEGADQSEDPRRRQRRNQIAQPGRATCHAR